MKLFAAMLFAFSLCSALMAETYTYEWEASERPTSILDGKVTFTYDGKGLIMTMGATPGDGNTIVFTGDEMSFASNANVTNNSAGTVEFQKLVAAPSASFWCGCPGSKKAKTYGGTSPADFITEDWRIVLPDARIEDWEPVDTKNSNASPIGAQTGWSNPNDLMHVHQVKREGGILTCQFQSSAQTARWDRVERWVSKCIKAEFRQNGANVEARFVEAWQVWSDMSPADAKITDGYDVDQYIASGELGGDLVKAKVFYLGKSTGYGMATIKFQRVTPLSIFRVVGAAQGINIDAASAREYVRLELSDVSVEAFKTPGFWAAPYERAQYAFQDGTFEWTGRASGGGGTMIFEATKPVQDDPYVENIQDPFKFVPTNSWIKVASNRRLCDLVVCETNKPWVIENDGYMPESVTDMTHGSGGDRLQPDKNVSWCYICGSTIGGKAATNDVANIKHPANLYNLKFVNTKLGNGSISGTGAASVARTNATVQVQCQYGKRLMCVYFRLREQGNDIYASSGGYEYCADYLWVTNTSFAASHPDDKQWLGLDFDSVYSDGKSKGVYIQYRLAQSCGGSSFGVRDLHLVFRTPATHVITTSKECRMNANGGSAYEVKGTDTAHMALMLTGTGVLPTNGTLRVKNGGEAWYRLTSQPSKGISGGVNVVIEKGGVVRQQSKNPFGTEDRITVDGGELRFEGDKGIIETSSTDYRCYLYNVTLKNGGVINGADTRRIQAANVENNLWSVCGSTPSTNNVSVIPMSGSNNAPRFWNVDVAETDGNGADFVMNGQIVYQATSMSNTVVRKTGAGTMVLNGEYVHSGLLQVADGTFKLGQMDLWKSKAPIELTDGGALAVAAGTETEFGTLAVADSGELKIEDGASVTFADSSALAWTGRLHITCAGELGKRIRFKGLTDAQIKQIRVNDGLRAELDADGYLSAYKPGALILFR